MKEIFLKRGDIAIVDDEDFEHLSLYPWRSVRCGRSVYAKTGQIYMHRMILSLLDSRKFVDHIDHNGLNNQRSNLRIVTAVENAWNSRKKISGTASSFKGVAKLGKKWTAQIYVKGKHVYLGTFQEELSAARQYNLAAKKYFGEFAGVNQ